MSEYRERHRERVFFLICLLVVLAIGVYNSWSLWSLAITAILASPLIVPFVGPFVFPVVVITFSVGARHEMTPFLWFLSGAFVGGWGVPIMSAVVGR
jgi:hypothetical protein